MNNEPGQIAMMYTDVNNKHHRLVVDTNHTADSFLDTFRAFLHVCGFHPRTVADLLRDEPEDQF